MKAICEAGSAERLKSHAPGKPVIPEMPEGHTVTRYDGELSDLQRADALVVEDHMSKRIADRIVAVKSGAMGFSFGWAPIPAFMRTNVSK